MILKYRNKYKYYNHAKIKQIKYNAKVIKY